MLAGVFDGYLPFENGATATEIGGVVSDIWTSSVCAGILEATFLGVDCPLMTEGAGSAAGSTDRRG